MDVLDLLTIDEAKQAVNLSSARVGNEDVLEHWVTAVSRVIDDRCGPVVIREVTETVDVDGPLIFLSEHPIASITSVTEYVSGTGTVLTAESNTVAGGYLLRGGVLSRRSSWSTTRWSGPLVQVIYNVGRYADTASVDEKFKLAAGAALRRLWAREAAAWSRADPFGGEDQGALGFFQVVDPVVNEWLADERRLPVIA